MASFGATQATASSAAVVGIDSLTAEVQSLLVNINQGVTLPAERGAFINATRSSGVAERYPRSRILPL